MKADKDRVRDLTGAMARCMTQAQEAGEASPSDVMSAALTFAKLAAEAVLLHSAPDERERNRQAIASGCAALWNYVNDDANPTVH